MEEMIKELKEELLGKEITLLDLDNKCERILNTDESIYEGDNLEGTLCPEGEGTASYYKTLDGEVKIFMIDFDVLSKDYKKKMNEDSDYQFQILVKVTKIWVA